jgi:hypothetical protein
VEPASNDPYLLCEKGQCNHDLARAVAVDELWGSDGPYPPSYVVVNLAAHQREVVEDDGPLVQQRWAV